MDGVDGVHVYQKTVSVEMDYKGVPVIIHLQQMDEQTVFDETLKTVKQILVYHHYLDLSTVEHRQNLS